MAKQFAGSAKFQIPGGQATPAPPVGTSLGKYGINLGQFVQQFNERTKEAGGMMIPVVVTVYSDRSFEFITKSPPAAVLLKKAANIAKGSPVPHKEKVGSVTRAQMEEIAKTKMADLNASDVEHAVRMVAGTARSMGLEVKG
jgi:large subunit ribosomal protein L11